MHKAVLFDLDNTLIDRDRAFRLCLRETFPDPPIFEEMLALDKEPREPLFQAWRRHTGEPMDQALFTRRLTAKLDPDPELLQALRALSSLVRLAIVSNGGAATQRAKLRACGLDAEIAPDCVFISAEVGMEKPDPGIFWLAARRLQVKPVHCLVVGDRPDIDGAGARAAGMSFRLADSVVTGERLREWGILP